jgi:pyridoxine kinase
MAAVGSFAEMDAVLSGYLGDPGNAQIVADAVRCAKAVSPRMLYVCDPVIGDFNAQGEGRSFVRPGVAEAIKTLLIPAADILLPNRFELGVLTGMPVDSMEMIAAAARSLNAPICVVTSVDCTEVPADRVDVLVVTAARVERASAPRLPRRFDGSGDLFAGLFLGAYLTSGDPLQAAEEALRWLLPVLVETGSAKDLNLSSLYWLSQTAARS